MNNDQCRIILDDGSLISREKIPRWAGRSSTRCVSITLRIIHRDLNDCEGPAPLRSRLRISQADQMAYANHARLISSLNCKYDLIIAAYNGQRKRPASRRDSSDTHELAASSTYIYIQDTGDAWHISMNSRNVGERSDMPRVQADHGRPNRREWQAVRFSTRT